MEEEIVKDSKYTIRVNKEIKDKFKVYCKMMDVSPSDMFLQVMLEFNETCDQIAKMKDVSELQAMYQAKVSEGQKKVDYVVEHPTFKS